jgi:hypothetical protein
MPRMLTALERRHAERDLDLARRAIARKRRLSKSPTVATLVKEQLVADIDDLEQECFALGVLLGQRTGPSRAHFATEHDSPEERPYQEVAR